MEVVAVVKMLVQGVANGWTRMLVKTMCAAVEDGALLLAGEEG